LPIGLLRSTVCHLDNVREIFVKEILPLAVLCSPERSGQLHPDPRVHALLSECPFLVRHLDQELSEGAYYIAGRVGAFLRDGVLPEHEMQCVFACLNKMGEGDVDVQDLLVCGILEMLTDTRQSIAVARARLKGPSRDHFERALEWCNPFER
jgi:hypothetical protein